MLSHGPEVQRLLSCRAHRAHGGGRAAPYLVDVWFLTFGVGAAIHCLAQLTYLGWPRAIRPASKTSRERAGDAKAVAKRLGLTGGRHPPAPGGRHVAAARGARTRVVPGRLYNAQLAFMLRGRV